MNYKKNYQVIGWLQYCACETFHFTLEVQVILTPLSISEKVRNIPSQDNFSRVDNISRSIPIATSQVECNMNNSGYHWLNGLATRASPDDLNPTPLGFFHLSVKVDP